MVDKIKLIISNFKFVKKRKVRKVNIKLNINSPIDLWRFRTYETKEPETLDWIDSFKKKEVFYDIGSNIGVYSLYASKNKIKVYSFEPSLINFTSLSKNFNLNNLVNYKLFPFGLSKTTGINTLNLTSLISGDSQHDLAKTKYERQSTFKHEVYITTIDELTTKPNIDFPNHIKIDVDGLENEIVEGAKKTLKNKKLKTLMIELNYKNKKDELKFIKKIEKYGLKLMNKSTRIHIENNLYVRNYYFFR